jgi:hypothetical protein
LFDSSEAELIARFEMVDDCRLRRPSSTHLVALFGAKRLDAITTEEVQRLKHGLRARP